MRQISLLLFFGLVMFSFLAVPAQAQRKFEKESRIKRADVPEAALSFIDSLALDSRVKWYLEQGLARQSIEAKFRYDRHKYSVEFDTIGQIEDVEIEIPWSSLEPDLQAAVAARLKGDCDRYLVDKIQVQYTGSSALLQGVILGVSATKPINAQYELVARCKKALKTTLFEYLFDADGKVLSVTEIILKPSSHLEY